MASGHPDTLIANPKQIQDEIPQAGVPPIDLPDRELCVSLPEAATEMLRGHHVINFEFAHFLKEPKQLPAVLPEKLWPEKIRRENGG